MSHMADDPKDPKDKNRTSLNSMPTIGVERLIFHDPTDLPGHKGAENSCRVMDPSTNKPTGFTIDFIPQIRHHRVTKTTGSKSESRLYHESMCCWEPLVVRVAEAKAT